MIIALKGYIGSGKTTVSQLLKEQYDFQVINADYIVQQLYLNNQTLIQQVNDLFQIQDTIIDKNKIKPIIQKKPEILLQLEKIVNPYVEEEINQLLATPQKENIVIECQNIDDIQVEYDYAILCYAPKNELIKRIKQRDNRSEEEINQLLAKQEQYSFVKKRQYTINTNQSEENIKEQLEQIKEILDVDQNWKNS